MMNFHNRKNQKIISSVIIIILVLAMIVPDVYKRQGITIRFTAARRLDFTAVSSAAFCFRQSVRLGKLRCWVFWGPVSYTHLDVYKRQGGDRAGGGKRL